MSVQTEKQTAAAIKTTRDGLFAAIAAEMIEHGKAVLELALRDVNVGRLLLELRATYTDGSAKDQAAAFNLEAERLTGWAYSTYRRVMQAASTDARVPGAADAVKGSVHALAALSAVETEKAEEIIAVHVAAGITPTAETIREMAKDPETADETKKARDAARRAETKVSEAISADIARVIGGAFKFTDENVQKVTLSALLAGMRLGAAHGPLTVKVTEAAIRRAKKEKETAETAA